ncbi:chorismate-binding protein [uncultured Algibacter sp.]|uniref:chorismate-binding protein n=1 Tax=uncultured Algibacter sp. TaxID=298659 RepID=UPI00321689ED
MISEDFFDRIQIQHKKGLPFVAYRKPNETKINGLLQSTKKVYTTEGYVESGFVFSPFDNSQKTILIPKKVSESIYTSDGLSFSDNSIQSKTEDVIEKAKIYHLNLIKKGVETIENSDLKKVVLSRQEVVKLKEFNPITIFKSLLSHYNSAFVYCWYHPEIGLWLGATPETLLKIEGHRFSIMALAGTQDYKGSLDVIWQDKEQQEQQYVTDFILDNLKPFVNSCKVSDTQTVKAGNLVHLKTMISAQLKPDTNLREMLSALHPTPAVCGLPKLLAKQFILEKEDYNREFYTGFLGELNIDTKIAPRSGKRNIENRAYSINKNSTQLYVNLRCMQLKKENAIIYVGGGITKNSSPEREWEETVSKSLVIKKVL